MIDDSSFFEKLKQTDSSELRDMNNYLLKIIEFTRIKIIDFLKISNSSKKVIESFSTFLKTINSWKNNSDNHNSKLKISDDDQYNSALFIKQYIFNFTKVFPNIISKTVDYDSIKIPKYMELSQTHQKDIKEIVSDYYEPLKKYYGNKSITSVCMFISRKMGKMCNFIEKIPSTMIKLNENGDMVYTNFYKRTSMILMQYFILNVFSEYIDITNNPSFLTSMIDDDVDEEDGDNFDDIIVGILYYQTTSSGTGRQFGEVATFSVYVELHCCDC
jgi:hypothetical protein